jgi:hypothetical protein
MLWKIMSTGLGARVVPVPREKPTPFSPRGIASVPENLWKSCQKPDKKCPPNCNPWFLVLVAEGPGMAVEAEEDMAEGVEEEEEEVVPIWVAAAMEVVGEEEVVEDDLLGAGADKRGRGLLGEFMKG